MLHASTPRLGSLNIAWKLAVSFGIVGDHGGRIDVESRLDAGSELSVVLPV